MLLVLSVCWMTARPFRRRSEMQGTGFLWAPMGLKIVLGWESVILKMFKRGLDWHPLEGRDRVLFKQHRGVVASFCWIHRNRGDCFHKSNTQPSLCSYNKKRGVNASWGWAHSSASAVPGRNSFLLFSSGSLAPALHKRGWFDLLFITENILCYVNIGDGVSRALVFTADFVSQPAGGPWHGQWPLWYCMNSLTHSFFHSSNILNTHQVPGPQPGGGVAQKKHGNCLWRAE